MSTEQTNQDFTAILLGDVDASWSPATLMQKKLKGKEVYSALTDLCALPEEKLIIPIIAGKDEEIFSCDITLNYDPVVLKYFELRKTSLSQNFQAIVNDLEKGKLRLGGYSTHAITEPGTYLEIVFDVIGNKGDDCKIELESYRINAEDARWAICTFTVGDDSKEVPQQFLLHQNYPNPFNAETTIKYELPQKGNVSLRIYDLKGRLVKRLVNKEHTAGYHKLIWDGLDNHGQLVASGLYLYRIQAGEFQDMRKLIFIK